MGLRGPVLGGIVVGQGGQQMWPARKQLMQLHLWAEDIIAAEKAGDGYAIAEIAVWMARIIESLVAEGPLPNGHGQDGLYYD